MAAHSVSEMLEQGLRFLGELTEEQYSQRCPKVYNASIGGHYRHTIDHVEVLLDGIGGDVINYDVRQRDEAVETSLDAAKSKTSELLKRWSQLELKQMHDKLQVICKVSYKGCSSAEVASTIGREAMYVTIHAVHHFALIGVICNILGIPMKEGFGIAPSTIDHEQKVAANA